MYDTPPTDTVFGYHRKSPPLFFCDGHTNKHDMLRVTREYFRMSRDYGICARTTLSNGATAGEYGMWALLNNHSKRQNN